MDDLTSTSGLVALGAVLLALVALLCCAALLRAVRRLRAAQRAVLGESATQDLVAHAAGLERSFESLHAWVSEVAERLDGRLERAEVRLDGAVTHRGLVRYDAYNEMSGRQSLSLALLDGRGSGVVLSSIHHRDQARLYAKQVTEGRGELELSPEEAEAVRVAMAGEVPDREAEPAARPRRERR